MLPTTLLEKTHVVTHLLFFCLSLAVQTRNHTVSSGTSDRRRRMDITAAGIRPAVHPMSGSAGRAPKSAPERPSLTHRSTSLSAASTRSGTSQGPNGPNWQNLWSSQRLRWKSGSRTGDIKPNGAMWRPSFRNQRKSQWKCWWGTIKRTITRRMDYTSQWLCLRTRASSTTRTCTTGASRGAWTACRVEGCSEAPSERLKVLAAVLDDSNFGDCTVLFSTVVIIYLKTRSLSSLLFLFLKQNSCRARPAQWGQWCKNDYHCEAPHSDTIRIENVYILNVCLRWTLVWAYEALRSSSETVSWLDYYCVEKKKSLALQTEIRVWLSFCNDLQQK